jgi:hypothetical protein
MMMTMTTILAHIANKKNRRLFIIESYYYYYFDAWLMQKYDNKTKKAHPDECGHNHENVRLNNAIDLYNNSHALL